MLRGQFGCGKAKAQLYHQRWVVYNGMIVLLINKAVNCFSSIMASKECKLIVLGDSGVGKTTIIHRFVGEEFRADFKATIGADFSTITIGTEQIPIELQIWDTAGDERFHSVGASFYRGTDACILVFDLTSHSSFERLSFWQNDLIEKASISNPQHFPFIILGNKEDMTDQRTVSYAEANQWAEAHGMPYFEVSAKSGKNIQESFQKLATDFLATYKEDVQSKKVGLRIEPNSVNDDNGRCC